jgi:hypothetical protein
VVSILNQGFRFGDLSGENWENSAHLVNHSIKNLERPTAKRETPFDGSTNEPDFRLLEYEHIGNRFRRLMRFVPLEQTMDLRIDLEGREPLRPHFERKALSATSKIESELFAYADAECLHFAIKVTPLKTKHLRRPAHIVACLFNLFEDVFALVCIAGLLQGRKFLSRL